MKLSNSKTIRSLDVLITIVLIFYFVFLGIKLFNSGAPAVSNSLKGYAMYDIQAKPHDDKRVLSLADWFGKKVVVQPTNRARVELRFKSYDELFSLPALSYQVFQLFYWLLIGFLILCIKRVFSSFRKDEVFTTRNASLILWGSAVLMILPVMRSITQRLFINCIIKLNLNDSGYLLQKGAGFIASETFIGLALLAFGLVFKTAIDIKKENDSFI
ncbi:DUF2975 domain-containing protein [Parapedobacter sp. DT-150]|uniref:DUF2975 domain-containing protein n=1 Tax=Parapedobacter sp. DT-150 TaxID=3396162 RepID=UPI003F1AFC44